MKKFRPYCAGFIVVYILTALCLTTSAITLIQQIRGTANEMMASFALFDYLIAIVAIIYVRLYAGTKVVINGTDLHFVSVVYIRPAPGAKRAMIVYRSGDTDAHKVDKHVPLNELEKYGYIEDLGYPRLDATQAGEKNKLFPVREIALVLKDHRRFHLNIAIYSEKQRREMITAIRDASGIMPEGKLKELVG